MKPIAFALAAALTGPLALADTLNQGNAITSDNALDIAEMTRIANAIDTAVDAKDWTAARGHFVDTITVDFTSLVGGEPATIPADGLIAGWSSNLTAEKTSFHLRGNHQVSFSDADTATLYSHGYAWNQLERGGLAENGGNPLWEVWGHYTHSFTRTDAGWRVDGMAFTATAERGNPFVRNTPGN
ncbi:MAG: nuclear transport factor 2 family protein [Pseudomonadota bacterium]